MDRRNDRRNPEPTTKTTLTERPMLDMVIQREFERRDSGVRVMTAEHIFVGRLRAKGQ